MTIFRYFPNLFFNYCFLFLFFFVTSWFVYLALLDDIAEAYALIKDVEPCTPQEYILKGVVNAALGQEQGTVSTADSETHF